MLLPLLCSVCWVRQARDKLTCWKPAGKRKRAPSAFSWGNQTVDKKPEGKLKGRWTTGVGDSETGGSIVCEIALHHTQQNSQQHSLTVAGAPRSRCQNSPWSNDTPGPPFCSRAPFCRPQGPLRYLGIWSSLRGPAILEIESV